MDCRDCKDCINYDVCGVMYHNPNAEHCSYFKDKSQYIKLPCEIKPITTVSRKEYHNRIEVVKNIRYEWNECRFCFSKDEADSIEAEWKGE